jgi:tetratricopeptide (TPR) repeat protein
MNATVDATAGRVPGLLAAALRAARDQRIDPVERAEMLVELAMGLQQRPKTPDHLRAAIRLYDEALALSPKGEPLLAARVTARRATALQTIPAEGTAELEEARDSYESVIPILSDLGSPQEVAEAELNLGLVLQSLAGSGRARITDAIAAYQRSLRTFDAKRHPIEFVLLQNNLATAFLSIPLTDERGKMREALAVQCFEEGLKIVNLVDHPVEYAMLQSNLGNALQCALSSHPVANYLRALAAYEEALRVRTRATMPLEYANTIANKANCLWNLPDDPDEPERGNHANLAAARLLYAEAQEIFRSHGEAGKVKLVAAAIAELEAELGASPTSGPEMRIAPT